MALDPVFDTAPRVLTVENVGRDRFEAEIKPHGQPVLIRGAFADWDIVKAGRAGDREALRYVREVATDAPVSVFEAAPEKKGRFTYTDDLMGFDFAHGEGTVPQLVARLEASLEQADPPTVYAGAVNLDRAMPALLPRVPNPWLGPEVERLTSLWIGGQTRVGAHWDLPQNIAVCAAGRRRFTLFPIDCVPDLYIGPLERTPAGQPVSLVDFHAVDHERFPRFAAAARRAVIAEMAPGDALYLPSLWVHHVESPGPVGLLVNFWWRDGPGYLTTPTHTLMHAMLTLREMPAEERARWRVLFDHFVFGVNGDPAAHMPEAARGVLGAMTPDKVAWLKKVLGGSLGR